MVREFTLWVPDHASVLGRGTYLRTAASTPCFCADVCCLGQGRHWGKASLWKVSVPQKNVLMAWWTRKSAVSIGHLVGKAPSLCVTITNATSEIWRGRARELCCLVLNESPCVAGRSSGHCYKHDNPYPPVASISQCPASFGTPS